MVLKILYIHHHPHIGGSSKSLIELLQIIKNKKKIEIDIISPNGSALEKIKNLKINYYAFLGIPIFDNSNWGYYKGFRWIVLIREIFNFIFFYFQIKRIKKKYDIIHINEILCFPVLGILKKQFNSKIILHQRTRLNKSKNLRIKIMNRIIEKYADKIISIDNFCFQTLSTKLKKKAKIIHNGLNTNKVIIKNNKKKYTNIGFVGPLRESKGIYLLINSYLKYFQNFKNVRLLIFSHKPKKNYFHKFLNFFNIRDYFYDYYIKKKLIDCSNIKFMGFKNNWNLIYNNLDFLIFPNKDLAIGRPVFEAAFYKVPSIVCINKKNNAYVKDNISGFTYYPNTELEIKKSIIKALNHTNIDHIKKNSFIMAKTNFSIHKNANAVVNIYKKILCSKSQ